MVPLPGLRVYPMLQLTVKTEPVEPPLEGEILTALLTEWLPGQVLAEKNTLCYGYFFYFDSVIALKRGDRDCLHYSLRLSAPGSSHFDK